MSEFKVGDDVFIKAKIVKLPPCGDSGYLVVSSGDLMSHWESEVYPIPEKTYEDGLNDAWELAVKLFYISGLELDKIFGKNAWDIYEIMERSPQEIAEKFKAWEDAKEIHVGDVVSIEGKRNAVVCRVDKDSPFCYSVLDEKGCVVKYDFNNKILNKTGRTIDIESLLKQIGGVE